MLGVKSSNLFNTVYAVVGGTFFKPIVLLFALFQITITNMR